MTRGLLDTSVFVALETGRSLDQAALPDEGAISPVTLAELKTGVLLARSPETTSRRLNTLLGAREIKILVIDERVADCWSLLRAGLSDSRASVGVNDLWIASTAMAHDLPVYTQDEDFDALAGMERLTVVKV